MRDMGDMFKRGGYATAIFGKWHLGSEPQSLPTAHGFDEFYERGRRRSAPRALAEASPPSCRRKSPHPRKCPAGAPGWWTPSARCEALSPARREIFRKPSGLWSHLHIMPGEREIRRALSSSRCCPLNARGSQSVFVR